MKTTIELPDGLLRKAKASAAQRGISLKTLLHEALTEKLTPARASVATQEPAWMAGFGRLRQLHRETTRVQREIDEQFGNLEPEDAQ